MSVFLWFCPSVIANKNVRLFGFCTFFKIFYVRCTGKKRKNVSFLGVYVCVKAKLTFVKLFFPFLFFAPFPKLFAFLERKIAFHFRRRENFSGREGHIWPLSMSLLSEGEAVLSQLSEQERHLLCVTRSWRLWPRGAWESQFGERPALHCSGLPPFSSTVLQYSSCSILVGVLLLQYYCCSILVEVFSLG